MSSNSTPILLTEPAEPTSARILQLYPHIELYSLGEPPTNTLFVLSRPPLAVAATEAADQLLLIDPPADAPQRFRLPTNTATLFTGAGLSMGLPQVQTNPGGVAHIRIGEHLLDLYCQSAGNVVHLPALGILCSGWYGSDATLPQLSPGSNGTNELDTLRLLARLVKGRRLQLYIPQAGSLSSDPTEVMRRLANDVAYLHSLQRNREQFIGHKGDVATLHALAEPLLPTERRSPTCQAAHWANIEALATNPTASDG